MTQDTGSDSPTDAATPTDPSWRKRLLQWLAVALLLGSCAYFLYHLWTNLHRLPPITWNASALLVMGLAVLGCLSSVPIIALIWRMLLRDQGVTLPYRQALQIIAVSQMGKYLPGNVGHFAGRVLLGGQAGVPAGKTIATMAMETFWVLGISGILGGLGYGKIEARNRKREADASWDEATRTTLLAQAQPVNSAEMLRMQTPGGGA
jgi:hypothetical protein